MLFNRVWLCVFFAFFGLISSELQEITPDTGLTEVIEDLHDELRELLTEEEWNAFSDRYYAEYDLLDGLNVNSLLGMLGKPYADNKTCHMCNTLIGLGRQIMTSKEVLMGLVLGVCKDSDSLSKRACTELLERFADPVVWLFKNTKLATEEICSLLVGHGCLGFLEYRGSNASITWELPLPAKAEYKPKPATAGVVKKVLHLTDIHLDLWYTVGAPAKCNEPLCCRSTSNDTLHKNVSAGFWHQVEGDCDSPLNFVINSLKQIAARHPDISAIYWTGDNVPHDVWNTTQPINLRHIHTVSGIVSVAFNNIPVFPVLGNHEVHPINLYIPEAVRTKDANQSMTWLYNTLTAEHDYWAKWLDTEEIRKTFHRGGYYSKMFSPSWKVIVLNSNVAQKQNFWILYNPVDPDGQLAWLISELDHAEKTGAKVTILGHVPPRHENYDAWVHNYIRIVDRYQDVIASTYYGHTHKDEVVVLYNHEKKPVSVSFISGSLTTFSNLNPQYTIFEVDSNGTPLDSTVYLTDMDEANARHKHDPHARPVWREEYHPKKSYHLADMSPKSWDAFLTAAATDLDLAFLYANHYHRYSKEFSAHEPKSIEQVKRMLQDVKRYSPFLHLENNDGDDQS